MELERPIKTGFLHVPPNNFLRKTWLKKYCAIYDASNQGIQRMEIFDSEETYIKQNPSKIVPLKECWKVIPLPQKHQPNVFEVRTMNSSYQFSADTFQDMTDWLATLQSVAFNKSASKLPTLSDTSEEKQEENLLYCSMDEPEIYSVKTVPTEAALRNNLKGIYKIIITRTNFSIAEECSQGRVGKVILTWPYRHIRRYGCSSENFSFEAGRKCTSGEGFFTFSTVDRLKIFQCIDDNVAALKSTHGEIDNPNSPHLKEDKNNCFSSKDSLISNHPHSVLHHTLSRSQNPVSSSVLSTEDTTNKNNDIKCCPPFKKPPRKSKSNTNEYTSENVSKIDNSSPDNSLNLYAEINNFPESSGEESDVASSKFGVSEVAHDYSNVQKRSLSVNRSSFSTSSDLEKTELDSVFETMKIAPAKNNPNDIRASSAYYENFESEFENAKFPTRQKCSAHHVYGRISTTRQSIPACSQNVHSLNSSTNINESPCYSNIKLSKPPIVNSSFDEKNPPHFLKNDAEYARVLKTRK